MEELYKPVSSKTFYGSRCSSYRIRNIPSESEDELLADEVDEIPEQIVYENESDEENFNPEDDLPLSAFVNVSTPRVKPSKVKLSKIPALKLKWEEKWTSVEQDKVKFTGKTDLPDEILECTTPCAIFKLFFSDEFIQLIVDMTNLYSVQTNPNRPLVTTADEIKKFIGTVLWMSVIQVKNTRLYWSADTRISQIADIMPVNRFQRIKSNLHFNDNQQMQNQIDKIKPVFDHIRSVCNKIPIEENLSCDEQIVPFKGRIAIKTYNPKKPHKWGYKLWVLSGISGFSYNFELFTGKVKVAEGQEDFGSASNVVLRMSDVIPTDVHHKLFCDNYFTSIPLFGHLSEKGIDCLGTVRTNRLMGCTLPTEKEWKQKGRGSYIEKVADYENQQVRVVQWYDSKQVTLLSTFVGSQPPHKVQRFFKSDNCTKEITCPHIVNVYNKHMGGVDLLDSLLGLYRIRIRSKKWYHKLFFHMVDIVTCNSWLLYRRILAHHQQDQPQGFGELSLMQFKIELAKVLTTIANTNIEIKKRGRPSSVSVDSIPIKKKCKEAPPAFDSRKDGMGHWPQHSAQRNRCRLEGCHGKSRIFCIKCKAYLCLYDKKNCFVEYHVRL